MPQPLQGILNLPEHEVLSIAGISRPPARASKTRAAYGGQPALAAARRAQAGGEGGIRTHDTVLPV